MSSAPLWHAPMLPAARSNAGSLLVGTLLGRLPAEDSSALVQAIVFEQRSDGGWPGASSRRSDLSTTLEVVGALSVVQDALAHEALSKAVAWIERHRLRERPTEESLVLLGTLTDNLNSRLRRSVQPVTRRLGFTGSASRARTAAPFAFRLAVAILWERPSRVQRAMTKLLTLQQLDGSWEGSSRATVFALAALRHGGLAQDDGAFERGWRYLRNQQVWNDNHLIQNPCDLSTLMHATALRSLLVAGAEPEAAGSSTISLLHHSRPEGGWSLGADAPVDLLSTALVLDALSFAGDTPIETTWARRRAVMLLAATQRPDGGWPLWPEQHRAVTNFLRHRSGVRVACGSVDVTAAAIQALAYSGISEPDVSDVVAAGVRFLISRQESSGLWRGDVFRSDVFATARAIEALMGAAPDRAGSAILRATNALIRLQQPNGAWGEPTGSAAMPGVRTSAHHTAWALRALAGVPGVTQQVLMRGQRFLDTHLHPSEQLWTIGMPGVPLPFFDQRVAVTDLTSLWSVEAYALLSPGAIPGGKVGHSSRIAFKRRA